MSAAVSCGEGVQLQAVPAGTESPSAVSDVTSFRFATSVGLRAMPTLGAPVFVVGGRAVVGTDADEPDDEHAASNSTRASGACARNVGRGRKRTEPLARRALTRAARASWRWPLR